MLLQKLLMIIILDIVHLSQCVKVVSFQEDGIFSPNTFIKHTNGIGPTNLSEWTVCARINLNFLRGGNNHFFSYTNALFDDALNGKIISINNLVKIGFCQETSAKKICLYHETGLIFQEWHHVCFSSTKVLDDQTTKMQLYYDGEKVSEDTMSTPAELINNGILIVGQNQDSLDTSGFFDQRKAFSGKVSQVQMWNIALNNEEIKKLASCTVENVESNQLVVQWGNNLEGWESKNVNLTDFNDLSQLCTRSPLLDRLIWLKHVSYNQIFDICDKVDGKMPLVNSDKDHSKIQNLTSQVLEIFKATEESQHYLGKCILQGSSQEKAIFWLAQNRQNVSSWIDPYDNQTDLKEFDIDYIEGENCAYVIGDNVKPSSCRTWYSCAECQFPAKKTLYLKGLCPLDTEWHYDYEFYVFGTYQGRPHFKGIRNSEIKYNNLTEKWSLSSLANWEMSLSTVKKMRFDVPLGSHEWLVEAEGAHCFHSANTTVRLTFSDCYPNKYTCNNGQCIPLSKKCNTAVDCKDKSDEQYCDYLRIPPNYGKELIPNEDPKVPLIVYLNVSVLAFPEIKTTELTFTSDYFLNLRWYDPRLAFQDLNNLTALNILSSKHKSQIWTPQLTFTNALGPFQTEVDKLTSGVLIREAPPLKEDISLATEALLFSGAENSIRIRREYYKSYGCRFQLIYYPFDTQMCKMVFEVQGKTDKYITLQKDGYGVEFLAASRTLVEYEIQMEALQIVSENNISKAELKFVFRRRMEFHVANTFLQTFLLTTVGSMSFYFDINNFGPKMQVTVTTMLVVATISNSIRNDLPKTSYYKMIDWWLLYSLNILAVSMGFHTYVAHILTQGKPLAIRSSECLICKIKSCVITRKKKDDQVISFLPANSDDENENDFLLHARKINNIGKILFVFLTLSFNLVFWAIAAHEFSRPAEEYLDS